VGGVYKIDQPLFFYRKRSDKALLRTIVKT
jgi:hypothetical protein